MNNKLSLILILVTIFFLSNLNAVQVKKNKIDSYILFSKGELKGTGLSSRGELFISNVAEILSGPRKEYYLSVDVAKNGAIYIGTGHAAAVYLVTPDKLNKKGKVTKIFSAEQPDIYAVLVKNNNKVIAGTSPNGKIFEISDKKVAKILFNPDEKFIWDIKEDNSGNIICAVGNGGGIYQVNPKGQATKLFTSEDSHILTLCITKDNSILAGSGDRGILYKIKNRKVKVLYNTPFNEIRGICEDKNRNIFFSGTKELFKKDVKIAPSASIIVRKREKMPTVKETSALYCLSPNGNVEQIWLSKDEYIYAISYDNLNDRIICCTGNSGRIYSIKKDGSFSIIYEGESAQVFKSVRGQNGFYLITNNTPSLLKINDIINTQSSYLSQIYDMKTQSKIGKLYWEAEKEKGCNISLFIRAGNSNLPDKTWVAWSPPYTNNENSTANISGYRYFQVKINLSSTDIGKSPVLKSFKVYYIQSNQKPHLKSVKILKKAVSITNKEGKTKSSDNKNLSIQWIADDPNKDKLKFSIFIRRVQDKNWILLKDNFTGIELDINPLFFWDGKYVVKVQVDDSLDNPHSTVLSNSLISAPFIIDSTPPEFQNFKTIKNTISFSVVDKTSIISQVYYSTDRKLWYPLFPIDSITDSRSENYNLPLSGLKTKKYIFFKLVDEMGNFKVFQQEL